MKWTFTAARIRGAPDANDRPNSAFRIRSSNGTRYPSTFSDGQQNVCARPFAGWKLQHEILLATETNYPHQSVE